MNNKQMTEEVNNKIREYKTKEGMMTDGISDGYHTFGELYKHRFHLYIALCKNLGKFGAGIKHKDYCVRSKIHNDGLNVWDEWGMFLLQLKTSGGLISYHLPKEYWDLCDFAKTEEQATIPFDGHTPEDVLERLLLI